MHDQETLEVGCHRQGEGPVGAESAECLAGQREPGTHRLSCMAQEVEPPEVVAMQSSWLDQSPQTGRTGVSMTASCHFNCCHIHVRTMRRMQRVLLCIPPYTVRGPTQSGWCDIGQSAGQDYVSGASALSITVLPAGGDVVFQPNTQWIQKDFHPLPVSTRNNNTPDSD